MSKTKKIIYWISTLWLASGMIATGIQQLLNVKLEGALSPPGVYGITKLGYPVYILALLGIWKILGTAVLLAPKLPLVKEWAYAGFFFLLTGAVYSHIAVGHSPIELIPSLLLLVLLVVSWYLRPESRKIISVSNRSADQ